MRKMSRDEIINVIGSDVMLRPVIENVDLSNVDLSEIEFRYVTFINCDFKETNFTGCRFIRSDFYGCNCTKAIFKNTEANIRFDSCTSLVGAIFDGSYLNNLLFSYCDISEISLKNIRRFGVFSDCPELVEGRETFPYICPKEGEFIGYKKCIYSGDYGVSKCVVKLLIPEDAKRLSGFSNKCRCSKAKVFGFYDPIYGIEILKLNAAFSWMHISFVYPINEWVYSDSFDENRWNECSNGIHFFMSFKEAAEYQLF